MVSLSFSVPTGASSSCAYHFLDSLSSRAPSSEPFRSFSKSQAPESWFHRSPHPTPPPLWFCPEGTNASCFLPDSLLHCSQVLTVIFLDGVCIFQCSSRSLLSGLNEKGPLQAHVFVPLGSQLLVLFAIDLLEVQFWWKKFITECFEGLPPCSVFCLLSLC